jgi:hypothetical protein
MVQFPKQTETVRDIEPLRLGGETARRVFVVKHSTAASWFSRPYVATVLRRFTWIQITFSSRRDQSSWDINAMLNKKKPVQSHSVV